MSSLTKHLSELLEDGCNYEEARGKGVYIKCQVNWFDAIDAVASQRVRQVEKINCYGDQKICWQAINEIP